MKVKFVKVWDDKKFGYVKHIILQVEKSDTFLIEENFNPGYKFIITAIHHHVGAAGGNEFNPYYGNRVRDISRKINSTESDVLGFYLEKINDIYDMPEEIYTDSFWDVVRTDGYIKSNKDFYDDYESYYKVLHTSMYSFKELNAKLLDIKNEENEYFKDKEIDLEAIINKNEKWNEAISRNSKNVEGFTEDRKSIRFAIIDKESLEIVNDKFSTSVKSIIAEYLWCPCDELPDSLWKQVQDKNELGLDRKYKVDEDVKVN